MTPSVEWETGTIDLVSAISPHTCPLNSTSSLFSWNNRRQEFPLSRQHPYFSINSRRSFTTSRVLLLSKDVLPSERYLYARDLAFFSLDFFSGDRASDLGRIKTIDVLRHPQGTSLLFYQHMGKTLRGKHSRAFAVKRTANPAICPVQNLQFYINLCASMQVKLSSGFLFHPTTSKGCISNAPFLASTMQARLVKYLSTLGIYDGESVHGFRGGTSILLRLLGVSKEEVAKDVGWLYPG